MLDICTRHVAVSSFPTTLLKPVLALSFLHPPSPTFLECLRELRSICSARKIFPTSYILSSSLLSIGPDPFACGGFGDVYHGTLDGSRVCIKHERVYAKGDGQEVTKVCLMPSLSCSPSLKWRYGRKVGKFWIGTRFSLILPARNTGGTITACDLSAQRSEDDL